MGVCWAKRSHGHGGPKASSGGGPWLANGLGDKAKKVRTEFPERARAQVGNALEFRK